VADPDSDGLLGIVGGNASLDAYLCGDRGLVRFYADCGGVGRRRTSDSV
jgi:hypothetical protein